MQIGFYGGSFDPPHRGHLTVALAAAAAFGLDRVLLTPTAKQPLKPMGAQASFKDRLAMVRLLCEGHAELQASALDAPTADGEPNYTVDTLARLREQVAGQDRLFVLVGIDAFLGIQGWRRPEELLEAADWIVVSRPGFSTAALDAMGLTAAQRRRVHCLEGVAEDVSATELRERLATGGDVSALLPEPVRSYIVAHGLYGVRG